MGASTAESPGSPQARMGGGAGGGPHLHALEEQRHYVAASHQLLHVAAKTLGQTTQQVQGHDHEVLVGGLILLGVLVVHLWGRRGEARSPHGGGAHPTAPGKGGGRGSPWPEPVSSGPG